MKRVLATVAMVAVMGWPGHLFAQTLPHVKPSLTVAVAANVQFAFEELRRRFKADTGITVTGITGSSGKLTTQIQQGAPFDVFLSADTDYPDALLRSGLAHNEPQIYAYGTLVLWTMRDLDLSQGLSLVADPAVKTIAVPAPRTAPYGMQAMKALEHEGLLEAAGGKLVYGESIAQSNQFITSGAADIGFTAKSVVLASNMKDQGSWVEVAPKTYQPIAQAAVILAFARREHLPAAKSFFEFLFSEPARAIFERHGYRVPEREAGP